MMVVEIVGKNPIDWSRFARNSFSAICDKLVG